MGTKHRKQMSEGSGSHSRQLKTPSGLERRGGDGGGGSGPQCDTAGVPQIGCLCRAPHTEGFLSHCSRAPCARPQRGRLGLSRVLGNVHCITEPLAAGRPGPLHTASKAQGLCFSNGSALPVSLTPVPFQQTHQSRLPPPDTTA